MNAQTQISAALAELPIIATFKALPFRDQLRLFAQLADEFSFSYGHDDILRGIRAVAVDCAQEEGWRGDDLAHRYLEGNDRFGPDVSLAPVVRVGRGVAA